MKYTPRPVLRQAVALGGRGACGVPGGWAPPVLVGTCFCSRTTGASGGVTGRSCLDGVLPSVSEALTVALCRRDRSGWHVHTVPPVVRRDGRLEIILQSSVSGSVPELSPCLSRFKRDILDVSVLGVSVISLKECKTVN